MYNNRHKLLLHTGTEVQTMKNAGTSSTQGLYLMDRSGES